MNKNIHTSPHTLPHIAKAMKPKGRVGSSCPPILHPAPASSQRAPTPPLSHGPQLDLTHQHFAGAERKALLTADI